MYIFLWILCTLPYQVIPWYICSNAFQFWFQTNTFQVVLATDGTRGFGFYLYKDIKFGMARFGDVCHFQVGVISDVLPVLSDGHICINPSWWRHQMQTFSALLALCEGNPQVTSGISSQRPVTRIWYAIALIMTSLQCHFHWTACLVIQNNLFEIGAWISKYIS